MSGSTKGELRDVILAPVVSEKSYSLLDDNAYTFVVHKRANKTEIRQAVEQIWGVRVLAVNTLNRKGKQKRFRGIVGRQKDYKKAVVTLVEGHAIDVTTGL